MLDLFADGLTYLALGVAAWAVLLMVLDQPALAGRPLSAGLLVAVGLLELGLLAQAVAGGFLLAATDRPLETFSFLAYLVGPVLIVPLATAWSMAERSRWGPGVLVIGCLAIPVMAVRLQQIWAGHG
ncbi:hypothetical protein [Amycolatopsis magusensis]|uniref:hypothetical protein n=1 Tax=Amycolatopsis magusensis TaxID=882444 RepID=UPI0037872CCD